MKKHILIPPFLIIQIHCGKEIYWGLHSRNAQHCTEIHKHLQSKWKIIYVDVLQTYSSSKYMASPFTLQKVGPLLTGLMDFYHISNTLIFCLPHCPNPEAHGCGVVATPPTGPPHITHKSCDTRSSSKITLFWFYKFSSVVRFKRNPWALWHARVFEANLLGRMKCYFWFWISGEMSAYYIPL